MAAYNPLDSNCCIRTTPIKDEYDIEWTQKLGTGVNGHVRPCRNRKTGQQFAVKCMLDTPKSRNEVQLQMMCSKHPHIVNIVGVYSNQIRLPTEKNDSRLRLLVVMELMNGGTLAEYISQHKCFTELHANKYAKQIALAIQRCHSLNIAHRDLKLENLLLRDDSENAVLKLSDFGFAKIDMGNLKSPNYTALYAPPEILEAKNQKSNAGSNFPTTFIYSKACDMWSFGVVVYMMLFGCPPFDTNSQSSQSLSPNMEQNITSGSFELPTPDSSGVSQDAINFVSGLLKVNPQERLTIDQILKHDWLCDAPIKSLSDKVALNASKEVIQVPNLRNKEQSFILKPITTIQNELLARRAVKMKLGLGDASNNAQVTSDASTNEKSTHTKAMASIDALLEECLRCRQNKGETDASEKLAVLMKAACMRNNCEQFLKIARTFHWNGERFSAKIDHKKLSDHLQVLMKSYM